MNIIYFDENDTNIPLDLISTSNVAKITGYRAYNLRPSYVTRLKIKEYCTIYKHKNKRSHCIFYSQHEVLEFLSYEGLERADTFNPENYYTYKEISQIYNINQCQITTLYFFIKKFKTTDLANVINTIKCYKIKKTNYVDKKSVDKIFNTLGYRKKE